MPVSEIFPLLGKVFFPFCAINQLGSFCNLKKQQQQNFVGPGGCVIPPNCSLMQPVPSLHSFRSVVFFSKYSFVSLLPTDLRGQGTGKKTNISGINNCVDEMRWNVFGVICFKDFLALPFISFLENRGKIVALGEKWENKIFLVEFIGCACSLKCLLNWQVLSNIRM